MLPGSAMYAAVSAVYINFVMDLTHHRVSVLNGRVPQHGIQRFEVGFFMKIQNIFFVLRL